MSDYTIPSLTTALSGRDLISEYPYKKIYQNIISEGLVLNLNSALRSSYVGTGSIWENLSSSSNNATLIGNYSFSDYSLSFSDGGYANIPNSSDFNFSGDFSLESWVYQTGVADSTFPSAIISSWSGIGSPDNSFILFTDSSNQIVLQLNGSSNQLIHQLEITYNAWNHIVVSRIGGVVKLYVNTAVSDSTLNFSGSIQPTLDIRIGSYSASSGQSFEGKIQTVRVYKNKGLTQNEVINNNSYYFIEPSLGNTFGNLNLNSLTSATPGFLTGRRPNTGQVFPRGVYNK